MAISFPLQSITDPSICVLQWQGWLKGGIGRQPPNKRHEPVPLSTGNGNPSCADTWEELKLEPVPQLVATIATGVQRIGANTSGLAAHLANEGVLPMYGLPTRVRDLVEGQRKDKPERSASIATCRCGSTNSRPATY